MSTAIASGVAHGVNDTRAMEFAQKIKTAGSKEGNGQQQRQIMGRLVIEAAFDGVIDEDQAKKIYTTYASAQAAARKAVYVPEASEKQQVSKLRQLIKLGVVGKEKGVDVVEMMNRACNIREDYGKDGALKQGLQSPYDDLIKIARLQLKEDNIDLGELSDDQIKEAFVKTGTKEKEELDQLKSILGRMKKIYEGSTDKDGNETAPAFPSPQLANAMRPIENRIIELTPDDESIPDEKLEDILSKRRAKVAQPADAGSHPAPNVSPENMTDEQLLAELEAGRTIPDADQGEDTFDEIPRFLRSEELNKAED